VVDIQSDFFYKESRSIERTASMSVVIDVVRSTARSSML